MHPPLPPSPNPGDQDDPPPAERETGCQPVRPALTFQSTGWQPIPHPEEEAAGRSTFWRRGIVPIPHACAPPNGCKFSASVDSAPTGRTMYLRRECSGARATRAKSVSFGPHDPPGVSGPQGHYLYRLWPWHPTSPKGIETTASAIPCSVSFSRRLLREKLHQFLQILREGGHAPIAARATSTPPQLPAPTVSPPSGRFTSPPPRGERGAAREQSGSVWRPNGPQA